MIRIRATEQMPASAERTWALLTDWESHSRWIPATEVRVLSGDGGLGTRFVGRSSAALAVPGLGTASTGRLAPLAGALGRVGFDDPMTVTVFAPTGADSCTVTWWEDVEVAPTRLTRWADPVTERVAAYGFARVLRAARTEL